jgi:hypothetical protein
MHNPSSIYSQTNSVVNLKQSRSSASKLAIKDLFDTNASSRARKQSRACLGSKPVHHTTFRHK